MRDLQESRTFFFIYRNTKEPVNIFIKTMRGKTFTSVMTIALALFLMLGTIVPVGQSADDVGKETAGFPAGWSDDIRLTNSTADSGYPAIAGVNETIYIVWKEGFELWFKKSDNKGLNWSADVLLSAVSPYFNPHIEIGVYNGFIHVIWERSDREVYYFRSQDYGNTWDPEICISDDDGLRSIYPVIAVNGSNLHVIWSDEKDGGNQEVYYLNSTDNGSNWNTQIRLTNNPTDDSVGAVAILDNTIHITWTRYFPQPEVMYIKSIDNGATWNPELQITPDDGLVSGARDIAVWDNYVHLSYSEHIGGFYETYYLNSSDGGETWSPSRQISDPVYLSSSSRLAVYESNVHLVWSDAGDLYGNAVGAPTELYYTISSDNGNTWANNTRLTIAENLSVSPSIILLNGILHIAWGDSRDDTSGTDTEVYYKRLPDFPVLKIPHLPIRINLNADFDEAHGVVNWATGDGSQGNPWIIENWDINGTGFGYCIFVGNATEYFEIRDCYLHDADGVSSFPLAHDSGVILYKTQNGLVKNNTLYSNDWMGVQCICSENNTISYNIANNNSRGIHIWYSNFTYVNNNNFSSNEYFGCYIHESSNNTFDTNVVCDNGQRGFTFISDSIYNNVSNNYVSLNGWGGLILQMRSNFNIINNNTISNNRDGLIISSFSAYNRVYHNNVINNTNQSRSGINNYWDNGYPSGGNYWSDYTGVDYNSTPTQDVPPPDGIGDTPYTIGGIAGVVDQYPLMAPFQYAEFNLPLQEGWNLISLPNRHLNGSIDSVLQSIDGFWDYLQTYNTETQKWMSNNTHRPAILNDLNEMNHFKAYWINITQPGQTLVVRGDKFDSPIGMPLKAGWNLVGYPAMTEKTVADALVGTGYDRPVEGFNGTAPYHLESLLDTYLMKPGEGYWVHVPADTIWVVDW